MKLVKRTFLIALLVFGYADACWASKTEVKVGTSNHRCVVQKRSGPNDFYYCGNQDNTGCYGTGAAFNKHYSKQHQYYHGNCISVRDDYKQKTFHYCCCGGSTSQVGEWVDITSIQSAHPTWGMMRKEENRRVPVSGKSCDKIVYDNVCKGSQYTTDAQELNVVSECSECPVPQVRHNNTCATPCPDGQGFKPGTNTCISCPSSLRQGVVASTNDCTTCETTQFYNKGTQQCVDFSSMTQVSVPAHNDCWLCGSPGAMYQCFKQTTQYGGFDKMAGTNAAALKAACSLSGENASSFSLPEGAVAIIDDDSGNTASGSDTTTDTTTSNSTSTTWTLSDGSVCNGNPNGFHTCTRPDGTVTAKARARK